ncbi:hypothetical protein BGZ81_008773 [Podila clonocystis]|nr:hypothetical protein BGZ81_008773 [Podila clonocystis]
MDTNRTPKNSKQPDYTLQSAPEIDRSGRRSVSPLSSLSESQSHTSEIRLGFRPCPHSLLDIISTTETDFTPSQGIHIRSRQFFTAPPRRGFAAPPRQGPIVPPRETPSEPCLQETPKTSVRQMSFVHRLLKSDTPKQATLNTPSSTRPSMAHFDPRVVDQQIDHHHRFPADTYQSGVMMHTHPIQSEYISFRRSPSLLEQYAPQALRCYGQHVYPLLAYQNQQQQQEQLYREQIYSWQAHHYPQNRASATKERHYYHHDPSHAFADQVEARRMSREESRDSGPVTPVQLALGTQIALSSHCFSSVLPSDDGRDRDSADTAYEAPKRCENCGARETPSWRRCIQTAKLLCNACGFQKHHGTGRPLTARRGRRNLSQQPQQQEATTRPVRTSLERAQYRPYPSPSKTLNDTKIEKVKEAEKKSRRSMKKMCKICGVKTSSTWQLALPGEVSGVICDSCSLQAKLRKVGEKIQQRIGHRHQQ